MADLQALQDFLISARSRTDASSFPGLRPALASRDPRGRRILGISQLQMDALLGRAAGTYGRLERGAGITPGLLQDVAKALRLTEDEWRAVWHFAYSAEPPNPLHPSAGLVLPGEWQYALDAIGSAAYIIDREYRVVAHNAAFRAAFGAHRAPSNLLRWALTERESRGVLLDWRTAWAPGLFAQLRAALARHADSAALSALRADVLATDETARLYQAAGSAASAGPQATRPRPFRHAQLGTGWLTMCAAGPADAPGSRLTICHFGTTPPAPGTPMSARTAPVAPVGDLRVTLPPASSRRTVQI
jgi:hypothetical protein